MLDTGPGRAPPCCAPIDTEAAIRATTRDMLCFDMDSPRALSYVAVPWLFLAAYTCSGIAGLVYEVTWTRQLTLHLGHTTAAASAVVGAFLLGLAVGAAIIGSLATRLSRSQALYGYAALELGVAACALALPWELAALTPVLRWAYQDGAPGSWFPLVRVLSCLPMVLVPAIALGATFPLAVRWFAADSDAPARRTAVLYATNTAGAAVGALVAGFVLIPALGLRGTTAVGVAASALSALVVARSRALGDRGNGKRAGSAGTTGQRAHHHRRGPHLRQ